MQIIPVQWQVYFVIIPSTIYIMSAIITFRKYKFMRLLCIMSSFVSSIILLLKYSDL